LICLTIAAFSDGPAFCNYVCRSPISLSRAAFSHAKFQGEAAFYEADFQGEADFDYSQFYGITYFILGYFNSKAKFNYILFEGKEKVIFDIENL
jgi:uncharacterized protein YjbI with pentapeptide repeats